MGQSVPNPGPQVVATVHEQGLAPVVGQGSIPRHDAAPAVPDGVAVTMVAAAQAGLPQLASVFVVVLGGPHAVWWQGLTAQEQADYRAGMLRLRDLAHAIVNAGL